MKLPVLFSFLTIFPSLLIGQSASEAELDSLSRPLPASATVREQAEHCREIMWYLFTHNIWENDRYDPLDARLDSLFHCCINGKTKDKRFEKTIEADLDFYKGVMMMVLSYYPDSSRCFFERALVKYTAIGDSLKIGWSHLSLGQIAINLGDSLLFAQHYDPAIRYSPFVKTPVDRRHFFMYCAIQCRFFERYAESASHFFEVLELADESSDWHATYIKAPAMSGIAEIYFELGDFDNAERYARMGVQAGIGEKTQDSHYKLLGLIMIRRKAYEEALSALIKAEGCKACNSNPVYQSTILFAKATCYRKLGDLRTALATAEKAVQITSIATNVPIGAFSLMELAECEFTLGMTDKALQHALTSHEAFASSNNNWGIMQAAELLSTIYKSKGNYRKAFKYSEQRNQLQQQVERQNSNRQMVLGEFTRDNAAEKASREAEVKAQLDRQRNIRYGLFAGLGILALLAFLLYNRYRFKQRTNEQLEAKNTEVEAARRRAEASEAFKSRFLANMSHEIRTPLHGISGYTDLLLETSLTEKQRRYLTSVRHSNERLTEVVNDILDISKLEAGEVKLRQVPFSPLLIAEDVREALLPRAGNKGIELNVHIGEAVPAAMLGDPTRLYQILMNLAGNAVKFTDRGEVRLTVDGGRQAVDGSPTHPLTPLTFSISDTGIGIPSEKLATIFDSFQQAEGDTTARFGGTGLGLTIARELVQLHGSDIEVQSEVGKGSTFSFALALPLADAADLEETGGADGHLFFTQPLKILLADDNAFNREIAREALLRHFENVEIVEAVNGREAVELLSSPSFGGGRGEALVLMDMQMPEMNGTEATRHIRQYLPDIPIIALTASATPEEIESALAAGMNRHLAKPFKPHELARAIADTLGLTGQAQELSGFENLTALTAYPLTLSPAIYGLAYLRDFCGGDEEQVRHFVERFERQCPLEIVRLEAAFQNKDRAAICQAMHSFRPQLEFVGMKAAAAMAAKIENGARNDEPINVLEALFTSLKAVLTPKLAQN